MASEYGALTVAVNANTAALERTIAASAARSGESAGQTIASRIGGGLASAAKGIGNTLATGFAVATGAAGVLGATVIKSGASYNALAQDARGALTSIMGDTGKANALMDDLLGFAKKSPFPKAAFIEATQQLTAFGVPADKVITALGSIQDAAAATNKGVAGIQGLTGALSQMQSSGKFSGETIAQLAVYGVDAASILGQQFGKTSQQIKDMASKPGGIPVGQIWDPLITGIEQRFPNAAANVKNTWHGVVQSIQGRLGNLGSALVEPFISQTGGGYAVVWAGKIADMISALVPVAQSLAAKFTKAFGPMLDQVGPFLDTIVTKIGEFGKGGAGVDGILSKLKELAPALAPIAAFLAAKGGGNIKGMLGPFGDLLPTLNPVVAVLGGIIATSPEARKALTDLATSVMSAFGPVIQQLGPILGDLSTALGGAIGAIAKSLGPVLEKLAPVIGTVAADIGRDLVPIIEKLGPALGKLIEALAGPLLDAFTKLWPVIEPLIPVLGDLLVLFVQIASNTAVVDILLGIGAAMVAWKGVSGGVEQVTGAWDGLVEKKDQLVDFKDQVMDAGRSIRDFSANAAGAATRGFAALKSGFTGAVTSAKSFGTMLAQNTKAMALSSAAWVKNTAVMVAHKVASVAMAAASKAMAAAQWLVNAAMSANPITLVVIAVAALVAGIILLWKNSETFRTIVTAAFGGVVTAAKALGNAFMWVFNWVKKNWPLLLAIITGPIGIAVRLITQNWENIKAVFSGAINAIVGFFSGIWDNIWGFVSGITTNVWNWASGLMSSILGGITSGWTAVATWFTNLWTTISTLISTIATNIWNWAAGLLSSMLGGITTGWTAVSAWFSDIWNKISGLVSGVATSVWNWASGLLSSMAGGLGAGWSAVSGWFSGMWGRITSAIGDVAGKFLSWAKGLFDSILAGLNQGWSGLISFFTSLPGKMLAAIGNVGSQFAAIGKGILDGILNGMGDIGKAIADKVKGAASSALGAAKNLLGIGSPSKVFAAEVGLPITQGWALGIEKGAHLVEQAIDRANALPAVAAYGVAAAASLTGPPAGATTGPTVNVYPREDHSEVEIAAMASRNLGWAIAGGLA